MPSIHNNRRVRFDYKSDAGFTLLEVLIAIGITALIGLGAWQVLNSAINTSDRTQIHLENLNQIQKAMLIIKRDLSQLIGRSIRDEYGDSKAALVSKSEFYALEFSRVGWRNPLDDKRSEIQRVAYELDGTTLVRHYWSVLDQTQDSESIQRRLLDNVESMEVRFMNDSSSWGGEWPEEDSEEGEATEDKLFKNNNLPKAVKVILNHQQFGRIERLFEVGSYLAAKEIKSTSDDEGNSDDDGDNPDDGGADSGSDGNDRDDEASPSDLTVGEEG
jgi:general secretion pathway protein J